MRTISTRPVLTWFLIILAIVEGQESHNQSAREGQEGHNQSAPSALILGASAGSNSRDCILNTGQTCNFGACYGWMGDTVCDHSLFGFARCFCAPGTCVGVDGICHAGKTNTPPGGEDMTLSDQPVYKLRNARWPEWYAYVSNTGYVWVSKDHNSAKSEFTVLVPPRQTEQQPTAPVHLLFSKEWPDSPVHVTYEVHCSSDGHGHQSCTHDYPAVSSRVTGGLFGLGPSPALNDLGVRFERAPVENPNPSRTLVMIAGLQYAQRYLYVGSGGWKVESWQADPGAGGYWYFEPELPQDLQLPRYTGPRCSWSCGEVEKLPDSTFWVSGAADGRMSVLAASLVSTAIALPMLLGAL